MLLAAGLGKRLKPLTDTIPKPLLQAGGRALIDFSLERLQRAGVSEVVINIHHLAEKIRQHVGDGSRFGLSVIYSPEDELLETGGGIKRALPLLGEDPFFVISADTYIDCELAALNPRDFPQDCLGKLLMTKNPAHHSGGDFSIRQDGILSHDGQRLTYTGVGLFRPALVASVEAEKFQLRQVFDAAVDSGRLMGCRHTGYWCDVGTQERLASLRDRLESGEKL